MLRVSGLGPALECRGMERFGRRVLRDLYTFRRHRSFGFLSRCWRGRFRRFFRLGGLSLLPVWFLVGNGGMDYGDYYWGLYRAYYRDPFPHSLLSTRQYYSGFTVNRSRDAASSAAAPTPAPRAPGTADLVYLQSPLQFLLKSMVRIA